MPSSFLRLSPHLFFLIVILCLLPLLRASEPRSCFPQSASAGCPQFLSPLSFPFGSVPGSGHPSFRISCSSNRALISINNSSFSIISYRSGSRHFNVSLYPSNRPCLHRPIDLSGSPFHISSATCFALHRHAGCNNTAFRLCNHSESEKTHFASPYELFTDCKYINGLRNASRICHHPNSSSSLVELSLLAVRLDWDLENDRYFSKCNNCQRLKRGCCGYDDSDPRKRFICFGSKGRRKYTIALFSTFVPIACMLLFAAILLTIFRCKGWRSSGGEEDPTAVFLHRHRTSHLLPPVFTFEELDAATNHFDPKRKIGDGGFGSVYLAQLPDCQIVAVKRLHKRHAAAMASKSFCNEVLILSSISHPNLVKLYGYCCDQRGLILVYDYVPNGTLADHLHGSRGFHRRGTLTWAIRLDVALQTAMAIEYLHFSVTPAIVHRDITSSNIFVEKDMRVKLGDFGLSRLLVLTDASATCVWTGPQGTPGYLDPDYHRSFRLTEKSDVYSFGVVLFELISGMKAVDLRREKRDIALADLVVGKIQLGELRQVLDPALKSEEAMGTVDAVAELAFRCVAVDKDDRPDAREVVAELKRIRNKLQEQKPPRSASIAAHASKS